MYDKSKIYKITGYPNEPRKRFVFHKCVIVSETEEFIIFTGSNTSGEVSVHKGPEIGIVPYANSRTKIKEEILVEWQRQGSLDFAFDHLDSNVTIGNFLDFLVDKGFLLPEESRYD